MATQAVQPPGSGHWSLPCDPPVPGHVSREPRWACRGLRKPLTAPAGTERVPRGGVLVTPGQKGWDLYPPEALTSAGKTELIEQRVAVT